MPVNFRLPPRIHVGPDAPGRSPGQVEAFWQTKADPDFVMPPLDIAACPACGASCDERGGCEADCTPMLVLRTPEVDPRDRAAAFESIRELVKGGVIVLPPGHTMVASYDLAKPVSDDEVIATLRAPEPPTDDLPARLQRARSSLGMAHLPAASLTGDERAWYATATGCPVWCSPCPLRAVLGLLEAVAAQAPTWRQDTEAHRRDTERRITDLAAAYHAAGGDVFNTLAEPVEVRP